MARKNIFQLVEESYDIQSEIRKINTLFTDEDYFESAYNRFSFKDILSEYLFSDWKYRGTCLDIDEYLSRADAHIPRPKQLHIEEDQIINYLEVMENFLKLYFDHGVELSHNEGLDCDIEFSLVFLDLVTTLEQKMGLCTREYKDKVLLYPKNAPLEKVIDLCEDEDVQWELIRYVRENLSLTEKRKSLAYLATNLYIEEDKTETDEHIKELIKKAGNILNNLHIRHNNKTGKWENKALKDLDEADAISLCDMVYNEMLTIVLLREHKEYDRIYAEFNRKQKAAKAEKKAGGQPDEQT